MWILVGLLFLQPLNTMLQIDLGKIQAQQILIRDVNTSLLVNLNTTESLAEINVESFSSGIYFLSVLTTNQEWITKRFVKQ